MNPDTKRIVKIVVLVFLGLFLLSSIFSLFGAVFHATFGLLGAIFRFVRAIVFNPIVLLLVVGGIVYLAVASKKD